MKDILLAALSIVSTFLILFALIGLGKIPAELLCFVAVYTQPLIFFVSGWYIVWKLFLSRFKLIRELLGVMNESASIEELKNNRTKSRKSRRD